MKKGGHIKGAVNIETKEDLEKLLVTYRNLLLEDKYLEWVKQDLQGFLENAHLIEPQDVNLSSSEPPILIFHCEFSQKRGPRAFETLRSLDRELNAIRYPYLHYSQVYLLEGGYKNFHSQFPVILQFI